MKSPLTELLISVARGCVCGRLIPQGPYCHRHTMVDQNEWPRKQKEP